ncbi:MAG: hypothetical protein ACSLFR_13730 [Solirubrobacteraceae bacterium]
MASIAKRPGRRWEIRESVTGPRGPRSRTLATFDALTPDVLAHAQARATRPFDAAELRARARRAGAPVTAAAADTAARALLSALARGERPRPVLAGLVADGLAVSGPPISDAARAAAAWAGRDPADRAAALVDLLLLADALPARPRGDRSRMPRLVSSP